MNTVISINKKLWEVYLLFSRNPLVLTYTRELKFYKNKEGGLLGLISLDLIDNDYYACILSRDASKRYCAIEVAASIQTIVEAECWIQKKIKSCSVEVQENDNFFDLFMPLKRDNQHPHFKLLNEHVSFSSAKEIIQEVSYHYEDIDGNFIEQFQSLNGFDSRIWELYLFCFFREQHFSFERNFFAPDYMVEKFNGSIAVEAVIISRKRSIETFRFENISFEKNQERLRNEIPLLYGSALFDKMKKKYWEKEHVKNKPFVIAIADFHEALAMTWTFNALSEYLYGFKYEHSFDDEGNIVVQPVKVEGYTKLNGTKISSGFFFQKDSQNVSAILFSSCGTVSKFNRMGRQAGLGNTGTILIKTASLYNHNPNSDKPISTYVTVDENSSESWSEGVIIFHNPNAKIPLNSDVFDEKVAQCYFRDERIYSFMPKHFPFNSITLNLSQKSSPPK